MRVTFDVEASGRVPAATSPWTARRERQERSETAALKRALESVESLGLAAMQPGRIYHGVAVSKRTHASAPILLRLTAQDRGVIAAVLESPGHDGWTRAFRGSVGDNVYRAGKLPIRLRSTSAQRC